MRLVTRDSPKDLHVARYFVPPASLRASAAYVGLRVDAFDGDAARARARRSGAPWRGAAWTQASASSRRARSRWGYIGTATRV